MEKVHMSSQEILDKKYGWGELDLISKLYYKISNGTGILKYSTRKHSFVNNQKLRITLRKIANQLGGEGSISTPQHTQVTVPRKITGWIKNKFSIQLHKITIL